MRTILTYALMVGGPLAGLLLILHLGAALDAPAAVGGQWQVVEPGVDLVVEQSGRYLRGTIDAEHFTATIQRRDCVQVVRVDEGRCAGLEALLREAPRGWWVELSGSACVGADVRTFTLARVE